mmetsp:Transcript_114583/g.335075  ORF Transcript_114583/g.335075 Transcript_114583/m.335075 type:complete len:213 (+) Transcript_114583:112-750(+)
MRQACLLTSKIQRKYQSRPQDFQIKSATSFPAAALSTSFCAGAMSAPSSPTARREIPLADSTSFMEHFRLLDARAVTSGTQATVTAFLLSSGTRTRKKVMTLASGNCNLKSSVPGAEAHARVGVKTASRAVLRRQEASRQSLWNLTMPCMTSWSVGLKGEAQMAQVGAIPATISSRSSPISSMAACCAFATISTSLLRSRWFLVSRTAISAV